MLSIFLTILYFLLPFNFALNPVEGVDLPIVRVCILGIGLFFLCQGFLQKKIYFKNIGESSFLGAFFLWAALSCFWAIDASWSFRKIFFLLNFAFLYFVLIAQSKTVLEKVLKAYVVGALLIACVGIGENLLQVVYSIEDIQKVLLVNILPFFLGQNFSLAVATYPSLLVNILGHTYLRASAFFPDPHIFSYFLGMALPFTFVFWNKKPMQMYGAFFLLAVGILLSFSRGGYGAVLLSIFWAGVLLFFSKGGRNFSLQYLGIIFCIIVLIFSPVGARLISSFSSEDGSRTERVRLVREATSAIEKSPLLGVGLGNYPLFVKPEALSREPIYAHNLYLDMSVELGLIGLFLFCIPLGSALFKSYRLWQKTGENIFLAIHTSLIYFVGHSFFESPLFSVQVLPVLLLLFAFIFTQKGKVKKSAVL